MNKLTDYCSRPLRMDGSSIEILEQDFVRQIKMTCLVYIVVVYQKKIKLLNLGFFCKPFIKIDSQYKSYKIFS